MNLAKSYDYFQPESLKGRVHIIGCGSVGSALAELLARYGITEMSLYDFDKVEEKNIVNQMFDTRHIGRDKVSALAEMLYDINPIIRDGLRLYPEGWNGQRLNGYVFLCVDSIELRKRIASENVMNRSVIAMFDFRTRLTDAQHYAADWSNPESIEKFIETMNFTHAEAAEATPVSACNVTLSVAPTVRMIVNAGVMNFTCFVKGMPIRHCILIDTEKLTLDAFCRE